MSIEMKLVKGLLLFCLVGYVAAGMAQQPSIPLPSAGTAGGAMPQLTRPLVPEVKPVPQLVEEKEVKQKLPKTKILIPVKRFLIEDMKSFPSKGITPEAFQAMIARLRAKQFKGAKDLTLDQIQTVAVVLTKFYRSKGFILTFVYIPPQKINKEDGVVKLRVQMGRLGNVLVDGNKIYSASLLKKPFMPLIGKPVYVKTIEKGLLIIDEYPGLDTFGVFRKGKKNGESDLLIKVKSERRWRASLGTDNNGTDLTGKNHLYASFTLNNLTNTADRLYGTVIQNMRPNNGLFGYVDYVNPFGSPYNRFRVGYSRSDYQLGEEYKDLDVKGIAEIMQLAFRRYLILNRENKLIARGSLSAKHAVTNYEGERLNQDDLTVLQLGVIYSRTNYARGFHLRLIGNINQGLGEFLGGMGKYNGHGTPPSRQGGNGKYANGRFTMESVNVLMMQRIFAGQSLVLNLQGQYSSNLLTSLEQFNMGGVNNVRAYPTSEDLMDKGVYTSLEWLIPAPGFADKHAFGAYTWGQLLNLALFTDYSSGWLNNPSASDKSHVALSGYGVGLEFRLPDKMLAQLQIATPYGCSPEPSDHKETRLWFNVFYTF